MKAEHLLLPEALELGISALHPYTQLSHIPWQGQPDGSILLDQMWGKDLRALRDRVGHVRIIAPQHRGDSSALRWGTSCACIQPDEHIEFVALPDLHRGSRAIYQFWQMWPLIRQSGVLHTNNNFGPYLALIAMLGKAARHGIPTVYIQPEDFADVMAWEWVRESHGLARLKREATRRLTLAAARYAVSVADASFCFGGGAVDKLRHHARNLSVIYHSLHRADECICPEQLAIKQLRPNNSPLQMIMACRQVALKGIDHALHALAIAQRNGYNMQLVLYGDGVENTALKVLVARLGIGNNVHFAGSVPHGEPLYQAIRQADIMLMPHRSNDFGRASSDALASGTPILAYGTETASAFVRHDIDGWLAEVDSPTALASQMIWLQQHRHKLAAAMQQAALRGQRETLDHWNDYRLQQLAAAIRQRGGLPA